MTDDEIVAFATDFRKGLLGERPSNMMCAMVTWPLTTLLNLNGVECESRESTVDLGDSEMNHIWIKLADGRVLDPTADQFGKLPPVYLGPPTEIHEE